MDSRRISTFRSGERNGFYVRFMAIRKTFSVIKRFRFYAVQVLYIMSADRNGD